MKKILTVSLLAAAALPAAASAQTTLAGWTFSQFLGAGYPEIDGENGGSVDFIAATYRGGFDPDFTVVDGAYTSANGLPGYNTATFGSWSFANFNTSNGVDVRAESFGALNFQNSLTLDGKDMALTDGAGMNLRFNVKDTLWTIQVEGTAGFTNVDGADNDFTFAARGNGGVATIEWLFDGSVFATSSVAAASFATYGVDLPAEFYGNGVIQGRLRSDSVGTVNFDNSQIGGSAVPEPSSFAALAGLAGLGFAASRRRRSA